MKREDKVAAAECGAGRAAFKGTLIGTVAAAEQEEEEGKRRAMWLQENGARRVYLVLQPGYGFCWLLSVFWRGISSGASNAALVRGAVP